MLIGAGLLAGCGGGPARPPSGSTLLKRAQQDLGNETEYRVVEQSDGTLTAWTAAVVSVHNGDVAAEFSYPNGNHFLRIINGSESDWYDKPLYRQLNPSATTALVDFDAERWISTSLRQEGDPITTLLPFPAQLTSSKSPARSSADPAGRSTGTSTVAAEYGATAATVRITTKPTRFERIDLGSGAFVATFDSYGHTPVVPGPREGVVPSPMVSPSP